MIGDLDPNEAEEIYQEKCYVGLSFEVRLHDEEDNRMLSKSDLTLLDEVKSASSYNNEIFVDSKFCESGDEEEAKRPILLDRERKKILKECESYLMKTEWLMDNWMRKKTEFILFDKGACSETKFNQSDDKHRKEMMLERHRKKMTGKLTARKKMTGEEGTDVFLAPSTALKDQSDKEKYKKERSLKDDDEADTVGCCTLKVENVEPEPPNILKLRAFKATGSSASGHVQTSNLRWAPANTDQHKPTPAKPFPEPETSVPVVVNDSESSNVHDDGHMIHVWNLPMNVTVTQLEEEFNKFGPIKRNGVQVISNKQEGFCFGCLEFESLDSMHGAIMAPSIIIGNRQVVVAEKTRVGGGFGGGREWYSFGRGDGFSGCGGYRGCLTRSYKSALLGCGDDDGGGRGRYSSGKGGRFRSRGGFFHRQIYSWVRGRSRGEFSNPSKGFLIGMRRPTLQGS